MVVSQVNLVEARYQDGGEFEEDDSLGDERCDGVTAMNRCRNPVEAIGEHGGEMKMIQVSGWSDREESGELVRW